MTSSGRTKVVVTDSCVIINLIHVSRLGMLGGLAGYEFVIPDHVYDEIAVADQRAALDQAVGEGCLKVESITDLDAITHFAVLCSTLGRGESACLAMAQDKGWMIASDERRLFRKEVIARLGEGRLLTTADLYVLGIRNGHLTVEEADRDKEILESRRFRMCISSFAQVAGGPKS